MSYRRQQTHKLNTPFQEFVLRMKKVFRAAAKIGSKPTASDIASQLRADLDDLIRNDPKGARRQWRRWYKANRAHQRRFRGMRQNGWALGPTPHSLKREWVK